MKWHTVKEETPQNRAWANAVFNQVFASRVIPLDSKKMTYIDVHTEASGVSNDDEGPVYRLFRNGVIDVGTPDVPLPVAVPKREETTVEFFVTMVVEIHVGFDRTVKQSFHEVMDVLPGDTMESLYWRAWNVLAKRHGFDNNIAVVLSWDAKPNGSLVPLSQCDMPTCTNPARSEGQFRDAHSR